MIKHIINLIKYSNKLSTVIQSGSIGMMKKNLFILTILFLTFSSVAFSLTESRVYIETTDSKLSNDGNLGINVFVDADEAINALHFEIVYSRDILELTSFDIGESVVSLWRRLPDIENGNIVLEGGSIQPITGQKNKIIRLDFDVKEIGKPVLSFPEVNLYRADGLGTLVEVPVPIYSVTMEGDALVYTKEEKEDVIAPTIDFIQIADNPLNRERLVMFNATDNQSGIKKVQIRKKKWLFWGDWENVTTNQLAHLEPGVWTAELRVSDRKENISEQTIFMRDVLLNKILVVIILIALILGIILVKYFLTKCYHKYYAAKH